MVIFIILCVFLLFDTVESYIHGHVKSTEINLQESYDYYYNVSESIPLMAGNWFYCNELFPKIRSYQRRHWYDKTKMQHPKKKLIPLDHDKWDWADQEYVQSYICNHTRMYFLYSDFYDPVGQETWTEETRFYFKCVLTGFANDKIRAFYKVNETIGATIPTFTNDAKLPESGQKFLNETEKKWVHFSKSISVKHQIFCEYDDELYGLRHFIWMWHNSNHNASDYSYWNFTETDLWDNYTNPRNLHYNKDTLRLANT